ncbi:hypothetical protein ABZ646_23015 [Streptomyces sp. NPDC007162]
MAAGQFWIAALPITTTSLAALIGPVLLLGWIACSPRMSGVDNSPAATGT